MTVRQRAKLEVGERAPDFVLPCDGTLKRFYGHAGGAPLLLVFSLDDADGVAALIATLRDRIQTVVVARTAAARLPDVDTYVDEDGKIFAACGVADADEATLFVLDNNLRVLEAIALEDAPFAAQRVVEVLGALPVMKPRRVEAQAPVLLVPRALELETCAELVEHWSRGGNEETGVEASTKSGRGDVVRHELKRRRDHVLEDDALMKTLTRTLGRRLIPELGRVFAFSARAFEGFKIVRYDAASGGFFSAHRDNLSPSTAHRRFALTLNLSDDYEGGELRFPEYGPMTYRPAVGEALLFSCSLLHEVTEVTAGERFALISFLLGSDGISR